MIVNLKTAALGALLAATGFFSPVPAQAGPPTLCKTCGPPYYQLFHIPVEVPLPCQTLPAQNLAKPVTLEYLYIKATSNQNDNLELRISSPPYTNHSISYPLRPVPGTPRLFVYEGSPRIYAQTALQLEVCRTNVSAAEAATNKIWAWGYVYGVQHN